MKICIVSRSIADDYSGSFELDQACALAQAGHEVFVLSLDLRSIRRKRKMGVYEEQYRDVKITKVNVPLGAINKKCFFALSQKVFVKEMNNLIAKYGDFDIIHAHFLDNAYIVSKGMDIIKSNARIVVTEHTDITRLSGYTDSEFFDEVVNCAYGRADVLITVSKSLNKIILENYGFDSVVINNVIDTQIFGYINENKVNKDDSVIFCSVGSLTKNKRMDLLIKCFSKAFENGDNYELYICGGGPEKTKLEDEIIQLGCKDSVHMLGNVSREKIAEIFKKTDIFVLLSQKETFGVAFIEAMASGLPVLSTKSGGPEEFITTDTGRLVGDNNEEIIGAMQDMAENKKIYERKKISKYAVDKFSPKAIAKALTEMYKTVLEGQ